MKINLNFQIKDISEKDLPKTNDKGEVIEQNHAGKVVGQALWYFSSGKSLKFDEWGRKLFACEPIELDSTDFDVLIAWLETYGQDPNYKGALVPVLQPNGVRGQIERALKAQKEKQEKK